MPLDLRISLSKLELFCLAAELKSFGRAAEQSFITQPVMTSHMRSLSERLGADLFVRDGNRMILTEEGSIAYEWARDVLARARTTVRKLEQIQDGTRGLVTVSACDTIGSYILPDIMADLTHDLPDVEAALLVSDTERTVRAVEVGERDFALTMAHPEMAHMSGLDFTEIGHEELVLVGSYLEGGERAVERRDVSDLDILAFPKGSYRQRVADWCLGDAGMPELHASMELGSTEAMKRAVRRGLGVAFLCRSSVSEELERGDLQELEIADVRALAPLYLIRRANYALGPLERRVVGLLSEVLERNALAPLPAA